MSFARYRFLDTTAFRRVIVTSDIHGDPESFRAVLDMAGFSQGDAVIIVGDILEKGEKCLPLLRLCREMAEKGNLFMVLGNNDTAFTAWREGIATDADMLRYAARTERSVLLEMARELGLGWGSPGEMTALHEAIFREYAGLIAWLDGLPHIIETEFAVFVHAGLEKGSLLTQRPEVCTSAPAFGRTKERFTKPVIVGHWPLSNYCEKIISVNPLLNREANVISIDGGNSLKSWGQLNYLVFEGGKLTETGAYDRLPKIRILEHQEENPDPTLLIFPNTRLQIVEDRGEEPLCFFPALGITLPVPKNRIYEYRGRLYRRDYTDYTLPLEPGETVSLCGGDENGTLVKKDGVLGYYKGKWERVSR